MWTADGLDAFRIWSKMGSEITRELEESLSEVVQLYEEDKLFQVCVSFFVLSRRESLFFFSRRGEKGDVCMEGKSSRCEYENSRRLTLIVWVLFCGTV